MPSLLAGTIAIVMMFVLVRSAGGPLGLALAAAGLLSAENLFFIHGRIATLDVLILPFMLGAVGLYVGRRRRLAGLLIGIGMCIKLVAAAVIPILLLWELLTLGSRRSGGTWPALRRALLDTAACTAFALLAYGLLLQALDMRFTTFSNAVSHTSHMLTYAKNQPETPRARPGFAAAATSTPWQWLRNERPILYYQEVTPPPGPVRQVAVFQGRMSPWLAYLAMPALVAAIARWWRRRDAVSAVIVAWFAGAFGTLIAVSLGHRFNYLYYMLIVVPGLCLGIAALLRSSWVPRLVRWLFVGVVSWGFIALYPIRVGFLR